MKAEEPGSRVPVVKYGLPASEQHCIVERHFAVLNEEQVIDAVLFAQALVRAPALVAALDRGRQVTAAPPVVNPSPVQSQSEAQAVTPNLRELLGLT